MSSVVGGDLYRSKAWRYATITIVGILLLVFVLYQQTFMYLTGLWGQVATGNYAHGYMVLLISAYLIYFNRNRLALLTPSPDYRAAAAIIFSVMFWVIAVLVDIEMLQPVGILFLLLSLVCLVLGTKITRVLAFPILYLSLAIPIWFPLSPVLQVLTADVVFAVIRDLSIPALRVENMILLPAGKLAIDEGCGGLNYFLAALTLSAIYAYLNYEALRSRIMVVLVSVLAAVIMNIVRVFIVVYLGYSTEMQHSLIEDHLGFGWVLFSGMMIGLMVFDAQLQKRRYSKNTEAMINNTLPPSESNHGFNIALLADTQKIKLYFLGVFFVTATIVTIGPLTVYMLNKQSTNGDEPVSKLLISKVGEWNRFDSYNDDWQPKYNGAVVQKMMFRNNLGEKIYLYLGSYLSQKQGEELINDLNNIADGKNWKTGYQRAQQVGAGDLKVLEQELYKNNKQQRLVWYWYNVAGINTANKYQSKALQVLGLVTGKPQAAVIAISVDLNQDHDHARKILEQFALKIRPSIKLMLER